MWRKHYQRDHLGNIKAASRTLKVCVMVNVKWFDFNKKTVFSNFDMANLPCRVHPPPTDTPCDEEDH